MDNAARVYHSNGFYSYTVQTAHKLKLPSLKRSTVVWMVSFLRPKTVCWMLIQHPAQLAPVPRDRSQVLVQCLQILNLTVAYGKEVMQWKIKEGMN